MSARGAMSLCVAAYMTLACAAFGSIWIQALGLIQAPAFQLGLLGLVLAAALGLGRRFAAAATVIAASASFWLPAAFFLVASDLTRPGDPVIRLALLENSNAKAVGYVLAERPDVVVIADRSSAENDRSADLSAEYPARVSAAPGLIVFGHREVDLSGVADQGSGLNLLRIRIVIKKTAYDIAVVHLDRPWPFAGSWDAPSPAVHLANRLTGDTSRLILVGDFNRPPWMHDMRKLAESIGARALVTPSTWPSWLPRPLRLPLDAIYVGQDLAAGKIKTGPDLGSDHLPVIAEIGAKSIIAEAE